MTFNKLNGTHRTIIGTTLVAAGLMFGVTTQASSIKPNDLTGLDSNIVLVDAIFGRSGRNQELTLSALR